MRGLALFNLLLSISLVNRNNAFCLESSTSDQIESRVVVEAQSLISSGRPEDAANLIVRTLRSFPQSAALYNLAGIAAAERNRNEDAENAFIMALKYSPAFAPAMLNLARIFHAEEKEDLAIATYERALRLDSRLAEAHANLAALLLERKDYSGALGHLSRLPAALQHENRYLAIEVAAEAALGRRDVAVAAARQIGPGVDEQDISLPVYVLSQINENNLVIDIAARVAQDASSKELRGLLAKAYAAVGQPAKARDLFESVARDEPSSVKPLIDAAHVAYGQSDFEGAAGYLVHAVKAQPGNADAQFFLGITCISLNLPGDAIHALREAVRLNPENAAFNYAFGAALLTSSDRDAAIKYFEKYIQLRPDDPHGKLAMGIAHFEVGDLESAQKDLEPIANDSRVAGGAFFILGRISRAQDDLDGAERYFKAAALASPLSAAIYANLGSVYIQRGEFAQARSALDRALRLESDNYLANENLLMLLQKQKDPAAKTQADRFAALTEKKSEEQQMLLRHIDAR